MSRGFFSRACAGLTLAGALLLSSCASAVPAGDSSPPAPPVATKDLAGTSWILDTMAEKPVIDATTVTLQFGTDGTLYGSSGCNRYSSEFTVDGNDLTIGAIGSTLMLCEGPVSAQENAFVAMLNDTKGFSLENKRLTLTDSAGAVLLVFNEQSQELAGSTWRVNAYNDGNQAVVSVLEGTVATLTFDEKGTLSGTGGCNQFGGEYVAKDGTISFGDVSITEMACSEPAGAMEQDVALVAALVSASAYSVEGDTLQLTDSEGATAVNLTRG